MILFSLATQSRGVKKVCRIVVVDDQEVDLFIIRQFLKLVNAECEITEFKSPEEALAFLETNAEAPDLIITDLNMPLISGHDLIREVRTNEMLAGVPVAVLTTSSLDTEMKKAFNEGADIFRTKPLTLEMTTDILKLIGKG